MKKNDPKENHLHKGADDVAIENEQSVPASIEPQKQEPNAGRGTSRLWLPSICGIAIIIGGALLGCSRGSSNTGNADVPAKAVAPAVASIVVQVSMKNIQYDPATVEVKKGGAVEWKNEDLVPHTVTSASFNSGTIASGQLWRHTFTNSGNFPYVCTFHPQMKGVVLVK
ncbi:MAG TPA: cupredoxin family copper-binding protein [Verrucomicrobiae bacterium]|nr:cupredoxin family copper-binding protein [Verrucomicrobiae bacterium]